jgi:hypothetical protein
MASHVAISLHWYLKDYLTVIRPVVLYGSEVWTQSKTDENTLAIWAREVLRKIFVPVRENGI